MRLSAFIVAHLDPIVDEWQALGRTSSPPLNASEAAELGACLKEILLRIAKDMERHGTDAPSDPGARPGETDRNGHPSTTHGVIRQRCGIGIAQLVSEFGSLRAIVPTRWYFLGARTTSESVLQQGIRFNQAVDTALRRSTDSFVAALTSTRDAYVFTLGQDLRSPLSEIYTAHKVLARLDFAPGTRQNAARQVRWALMQLDGLVSDLLEYTRSSSGPGIPLDRVSCDMRHVCEASLDIFRASHPARLFALVASGDLVTNADATRIRQALANLLHNAIKHGDGHSLVKLIAAGDAAGVTLTVWNAGRTIPAESLEAIFEPWVRAPIDGADMADRSSTNLGLGLFIAREIVNAHGGTIVAASSADAGTRVTIHLPRTDAIPAAAAMPPPADAVLTPRRAGRLAAS